MQFYLKVEVDKNQLEELFGKMSEVELMEKVIEHLYSAGIKDYFEYSGAPLKLSPSPSP